MQAPPCGHWRSPPSAARPGLGVACCSGPLRSVPREEPGGWSHPRALPDSPLPLLVYHCPHWALPTLPGVGSGHTTILERQWHTGAPQRVLPEGQEGLRGRRGCLGPHLDVRLWLCRGPRGHLHRQHPLGLPALTLALTLGLTLGLTWSLTLALTASWLAATEEEYGPGTPSTVALRGTP